ncbi:alpha-1B adrenergic receptor-like [Ptychodera flava]|uniref:alpha-1B adrenergic receptor-like n=1 Tax=Ptychodera flava TaxID=63121 RepID=UPI003969F14D
METSSISQILGALGSVPNDTSDAAELKDISLPERIIESLILTVICVVAIFGNVLLWLVVLRSRHLRKASNALVLCLSGADLLVSTVNMPMTIVTIAAGEWIFSDEFCMALGFINMNTFVASVMSLGAISINRYVLIVRPQKYPTIYSKRNTVLIIIGVWLLSVLLSCPPLVGWAEYAFLPGQSFCFCNWKSSVSYTYFMVGVCFGGPCSLMIFSYVSILLEVKRSRQRVEVDGETVRDHRDHLTVPSVAGSLGRMKNHERQKRKREEELKLTKSFVVVIVIFIISWLPFCVTMFWSVHSGTPVPRPVDMATLLLGYFNSCCNPIVYGVMNKRFRQGYMKLLGCKTSESTSFSSQDVTKTCHSVTAT